MTIRKSIIVYAFAALFTNLSSFASLSKNPDPGYARSNPIQLAQSGTCKKRMGPYATQTRAWQLANHFKSRGYQTSGVWGSGGIYSGSRGYYFNIFYRC